MSSQVESGRHAGPSFAALRHPACRGYLGCAMLAMMADNIEHVISYWIIYQKFQSPALAGFAVVSHWLPFLFFSVYAGALADRFGPERVIRVGMVLFMAVSAAWSILFMADALEQWHAAVLLVLHGLAGVLWSPASQLLVHDLVGGAHLHSAIRLMSSARQLGMLLGPAIGGGMILAFGPATGILINALFYLPLIAWLWRAKYSEQARSGSRPARAAKNGLADIAETSRLIGGDRLIVSMILLTGCASLIVGNAYQAQMPAFAHDLGQDRAGVAYSVLLSAGAAGALLAGIVLESRNLLAARPRTAYALVILWCVAIAVFALTTNYVVAVAAMLTAGFLQLAYSAMTQTLVQTNAPENIRGRVIGLYNVASHGMRAFSGITVGVGGSLIGIHWSLALSALTLLSITIGLLSFTAWLGFGRKPS